MEKCKICDVEIVYVAGILLCKDCNSNRFFDIDAKEIEYRQNTEIMITKLKEVFGDDYDAVLHDEMVRQLIRCEINMRHYEKKIANDAETKEIIELLRSERSHWRSLADKLNLTIKSIRKDTKFMKHEFTGEFKDYLLKVLENMESDKPKELPKGKPEEKNEQ